MTQLLIVDNFFSDPLLERDWALSLPYPRSNFGKGNNNNRTDPLHEVSPNKFSQYKNLIYEKFEIKNPNFFTVIGMSFQYHLESEKPQVHFDEGWDFAGVVYLTPDAIKDSGTGFYQKNGDNFELVYQVDNVFNRATMYPANLYHEGLNFFGNTKENSRLNLVFFARCS